MTEQSTDDVARPNLLRLFGITVGFGFILLGLQTRNILFTLLGCVVMGGCIGLWDRFVGADTDRTGGD